MLLLSITLIGTLLRLHFLNRPMRWDESYSYIQFVSRPLSKALTDYSGPNNHLFYTLLAHTSIRLFGNHPWALRLPAFLAGTAAIPLTFVAFRRLYGDDAALLGSALVAGAGALVSYSTNARGYTIIVCCFMLVVWAATALLQDDRPNWPWVVLTLSGAVGTYTVPSMLLPFAIVILWVSGSFLLPKRRDRLPHFMSRLTIACLLCGMAIVGLYFPVFHASGLVALRNAFSWIPRAHSMASALGTTASGLLAQWKLDFPIILLSVFGAGAIVATVRNARVTKISSLPLLGVAVIVTGGYVAFERTNAFPRLLLFLLPLMFAAGCAGLLYVFSAVGRRAGSVWVSSIAMAIALGLCLAPIAGKRDADPETGIFPQGLPIATFFAGYLRPGDKVVVRGSHAGQSILRYYFLELGLDPGHLDGCCPTSDRLLFVTEVGNAKAEQRRTVANFRSRSRPEPRLVWNAAGIGIVELDPQTPAEG
ncbi:MAG: glycosyltransferase family 39 protein [Actinomycetota bacterium]